MKSSIQNRHLGELNKTFQISLTKGLFVVVLKNIDFAWQQLGKRDLSSCSLYNK